MSPDNTLGKVFDADGEHAEERSQASSPKTKGGARELAKAGGMLTENAEAHANRQKHEAVNRVDHVVGAMERFADELHQNHEEWLGNQAASAAAGDRNISQRLRQQRFEDLAHDARRWSENPVLFLGGSFAIGLAAGRFITSSGRRNGAAYEQSDPASRKPAEGGLYG